MSGIFGACLKEECVRDLFFGIDYHTHLGNRRGGMAVCDGNCYNRAIHNIENTPFRTKFEPDISEMKGHIGIGCISDDYPQPIILNSAIGTVAVVTVGRINNKNELVKELIEENRIYFTEMSGGSINDTELVASLICSKENVPDGIRYAQDKIEGSMTMIVSANGGLYAARDKHGRTPLFVGKRNNGEDGYCVSSEAFAYVNLGYETCHELGSGEVVFITPDSLTTIYKAYKEMKMCTFLWLYYGFPASDYEGKNIEAMRYECGKNMAEQDKQRGVDVDVDYVAGIPDSGTPYAIGYANASGIDFARPLLKYTPTWTRSFMPKEQSIRNLVAQMKLTSASSLIKDKKLMLIDDSIVRGTQLRGMMDTLFSYGAKELHGRIGCPPVLFNCKYLNFTRSSKESENIARRAIFEIEGTEDVSEERIAQYTIFGSKEYEQMVEVIRKKLNFNTLEYHSLDNMLCATGVDKCKLCTYCWTGKE